MDVAEICNKKKLELKDIGDGKLIKPKAAYTFNKSQRVSICKGVKELTLLDGYASNLHGMKSHDRRVSCNDCFQLHLIHCQNQFGNFSLN